MMESAGHLMAIALVLALAIAGAAMTFAPRYVRNVIRRLSGRNSADEFIMPGALLSMRVIGATLMAVALVILAFDGRLPL